MSAHTPLLHGVDRLLSSLHRWGVPQPDLSEEGLLAGEPLSGQAAEGVRVLLDSLEQDANLHALGRHLVHGVLQQSLQVARRYRDAVGEGADRPLHPTVVIASMPRTGSTLLQRLLARHPDALYLPLWLQMHPLPPPSPQTWSRGGGARLWRSRTGVWAAQLLTPGATRKHRAGASLAEECSYLMMGSFASLQFWSFWPVHRYARWLLSADTTHPYLYLRRTLGLLQDALPGKHWVLKSPMHFLSLSTVLECLPEARIVLLHRDPLRCVPSTHSLLETMHRAVSHDIGLERTVAFNTRLLAERAAEVARLRDGPHADRFHDVQYVDLVRDPVGTARDIHRRFGLPWSDVSEDRVGALKSSTHPHAYSLERYGLDPEGLREAFSAYIERFRPVAEPPRG